MKEFGKKTLKRILLVALILAAGAGATYASIKPDGFRSSVERMKINLFAEAAAPRSSKAPVSSAPVSSAAQISSPSSSAPETEKVSLWQAEKPLEIDVSLKNQRVCVLDAKGRTVQEFVCSSGEDGSETPTGTFTITDRGTSFYNPQLKEGAYYWTRFYGSYLFHSLPFDKNRKMKSEEAAKLGEPASHGCIRLETEDAKWIYDHIPEGTQVVIR